METTSTALSNGIVVLVRSDSHSGPPPTELWIQWEAKDAQKNKINFISLTKFIYNDDDDNMCTDSITDDNF